MTSFITFLNLYHKRYMVLGCTKLNIEWSTENIAEYEEAHFPPPIATRLSPPAGSVLSRCSSDCRDGNSHCMAVRSCHKDYLAPLAPSDSEVLLKCCFPKWIKVLLEEMEHHLSAAMQFSLKLFFWTEAVCKWLLPKYHWRFVADWLIRYYTMFVDTACMLVESFPCLITGAFSYINIYLFLNPYL